MVCIYCLSCYNCNSYKRRLIYRNYYLDHRWRPGRLVSRFSGKRPRYGSFGKHHRRYHRRAFGGLGGRPAGTKCVLERLQLPHPAGGIRRFSFAALDPEAVQKVTFHLQKGDLAQRKLDEASFHFTRRQNHVILSFRPVFQHSPGLCLDERVYFLDLPVFGNHFAPIHHHRLDSGGLDVPPATPTHPLAMADRTGRGHRYTGQPLLEHLYF